MEEWQNGVLIVVNLIVLQFVKTLPWAAPFFLIAKNSTIRIWILLLLYFFVNLLVGFFGHYFIPIPFLLVPLLAIGGIAYWYKNPSPIIAFVICGLCILEESLLGINYSIFPALAFTNNIFLVWASLLIIPPAVAAICYWIISPLGRKINPRWDFIGYILFVTGQVYCIYTYYAAAV